MSPRAKDPMRVAAGSKGGTETARRTPPALRRERAFVAAWVRHHGKPPPRWMLGRFRRGVCAACGVDTSTAAFALALLCCGRVACCVLCRDKHATRSACAPAAQQQRRRLLRAIYVADLATLDALVVALDAPEHRVARAAAWSPSGKPAQPELWGDACARS